MVQTVERKKEYQKKWVANRRSLYFYDKVCKNCGSSSRLELHHLDPKLKISHSIWSWSKERREKELEKCIVLCKECHKEVTRLYRLGPLIHGIYAGYQRGCKCELCMEAKRISNPMISLKQLQRSRQKPT